MDLTLTEEQTMLQRAAKDFVASRVPLARTRKLAASGESFSREVWSEMAKLGWLGLTVGEEHGGAGLGYGYLMVVLEELGRALVPEPLLSTAVLGATAIELGGSKALRSEHLPALVQGERIFALAHQEKGSRFALGAVDTLATKSGAGYVLRGEKLHVVDGTIADWLIVSARAPEGVSLFLVPARGPLQKGGLQIERQDRLDGRSCAIVRLGGVTVGADQVLGAPGRGTALLERLVDAGAAALSAEMLGSMLAAFSMTLEYCKTRQQFGVPIGTFQALQHRASRMYVETELARSAVINAHHALDGEGNAPLAASAAKAKCTEAFMHVALEAVQMHGGIGMTHEHDIGLYLKRARVAEMTFGDAQYHRDRFARASGF